MGKCFLNRVIKSGGTEINEIIESFKIYNGSSGITAGKFVKFVSEQGSESVFNSGATQYCTAFALSETQVLVVYQDLNNSFYGTAVIGTISGTTISFDTPVVFNSANTSYISATMLSSTLVLIAYRDSTGYGTAQILSISGTTITTNTEYVFNSANTSYISATMLSSTSVLVAYTSSNIGTAQILSISGTTITTNTPVIFNNATTTYISIDKLSSTEVIVAYRDIDGYGNAMVLSISSTTITTNTEYTFNNGTTAYISVKVVDTSKILIAYRDDVNAYYGTAIIGTISSTVITFGTAIVFSNCSTSYISIILLSSTRVLLIYNSSFGSINILTISGTTITIETGSVVNSPFNVGSANFLNAIQITSTTALIVYVDGDNSNYGTSIIISDPYIVIDQVNTYTDIIGGISNESGSAGDNINTYIPNI